MHHYEYEKYPININHINRLHKILHTRDSKKICCTLAYLFEEISIEIQIKY
jgi:hypothetical protein